MNAAAWNLTAAEQLSIINAVSIFFPGLKKFHNPASFSENSSSIYIKKQFSSFARKEMAKAGHLPPQDKLEQLKELGARIYICGGSMDPFGVKKSELIFDDVIVAEYLTFLEIMDKADINIFLQ